jgi:hypothetical protein
MVTIYFLVRELLGYQGVTATESGVESLTVQSGPGKTGLLRERDLISRI